MLLLVVGTGAAMAQAGVPTLAPGVTIDDVNNIARELWCPLCSGVRLDSCELKACDQMKDVIAIKLSEGEDLDSIRDYFVDYYGPQVLGAPPLEGFNWLAWILPIAVVLGGAAFLAIRARSFLRTRPPVFAGETDASDTHVDSRLEEELKKYE